MVVVVAVVVVVVVVVEGVVYRQVPGRAPEEGHARVEEGDDHHLGK